MKKTILSLLVLLPLSLPAQQQPPSVQQQIDALKARITALEIRVAEQEAIIRKFQLQEPPRTTQSYSSVEAPGSGSTQRTKSSSGVIGGMKTTGLSLVDQLRSGMSYTKLPAEGPWTHPENWHSLQKGMDTADVLKLLGNPLFTKDSTRPRADLYWQYAGRLANGEQLAGRVRFYKDKLTTWDLPNF
jgi:hypothetical protein